MPTLIFYLLKWYIHILIWLFIRLALFILLQLWDFIVILPAHFVKMNIRVELLQIVKLNFTFIHSASDNVLLHKRILLFVERSGFLGSCFLRVVHLLSGLGVDLHKIIMSLLQIQFGVLLSFFYGIIWPFLLDFCLGFWLVVVLLNWSIPRNEVWLDLLNSGLRLNLGLDVLNLYWLFHLTHFYLFCGVDSEVSNVLRDVQTLQELRLSNFVEIRVFKSFVGRRPVIGVHS